jgi:hypothetical protein
MTEKQFRKIALGMEGAIEASHMNHPDFRAANGRIFATLRGDGKHGMVVLTPEQQAQFIHDAPGAFIPESGAWGRQGCTRVILAAAEGEIVGEAMTLAWQAVMAKPAARKRAVRSGAAGKRAARKRS